MEGIELDIFHFTEKTSQKDDMGQSYLLSECDIKPITFYNINAISVYVDTDDTEYCYVHSNGDKFICMLTYDELQKKLSEWKNQ